MPVDERQPIRGAFQLIFVGRRELARRRMLTEPTGHPKLEHRRRIVRVARLFWTLAIAPLAFVAFAIARVLTS